MLLFFSDVAAAIAAAAAAAAVAVAAVVTVAAIVVVAVVAVAVAFVLLFALGKWQHSALTALFLSLRLGCW